MIWPNGKRFAFSIFDDTDFARLENVKAIYDYLGDLGFRTTKSVWPVEGKEEPICPGDTCENSEYVYWLKKIQKEGFEIGYHLSTFHSSMRDETIWGLEEFHRLFGEFPSTIANHVGCEESIYWGQYRLGGGNRFLYNVLTRFRHRNISKGHMPKSQFFWGDICKERIAYVRNFVFRDINTLKKCPFMPYHDKKKPYVRFWFSSSDGGNVSRFNDCIHERNQDRLEEEGGACIMYAHLGLDFRSGGFIDERFRRLMKRLSQKNGWFVSVRTILDYLAKINSGYIISNAQRARLEMKWLMDKILLGTS